MSQQVEFFFDFISPYTSLAQTRLPGLIERTGARIRTRPIHLLNLRKLVGNDRLEFLEERLRGRERH